MWKGQRERERESQQHQRHLWKNTVTLIVSRAMVSALALLLLALQLPTSQLALQHVEHLAMTEQMSYGFVMPGSETLGVRSVVNIIQNELRCICTWQNLFFACCIMCCLDCVVTFYQCCKWHTIHPARWVGERRYAVRTKRKTYGGGCFWQPFA